MRRGEIWTVAGASYYTGKPRPAVIVQDDLFETVGSITLVSFTTDPTEAPLFRVPIVPNERNGLETACRLMADKIITMPEANLGTRIGQLDPEDMLRLERAILIFLGMAR